MLAAHPQSLQLQVAELVEDPVGPHLQLVRHTAVVSLGLPNLNLNTRRHFPPHNPRLNSCDPLCDSQPQQLSAPEQPFQPPPPSPQPSTVATSPLVQACRWTRCAALRCGRLAASYIT